MIILAIHFHFLENIFFVVLQAILKTTNDLIGMILHFDMDLRP